MRSVERGNFWFFWRNFSGFLPRLMSVGNLYGTGEGGRNQMLRGTAGVAYVQLQSLLYSQRLCFV